MSRSKGNNRLPCINFSDMNKSTDENPTTRALQTMTIQRSEEMERANEDLSQENNNLYVKHSTTQPNPQKLKFKKWAFFFS